MKKIQGDNILNAVGFTGGLKIGVIQNDAPLRSVSDRTPIRDLSPVPIRDISPIGTQPRYPIIQELPLELKQFLDQEPQDILQENRTLGTELKKNSVPLPAVIFEQQNVLTHDSFSHEQKTILLDAQILFEQKFPVLTQKIKNAGTKEEKIALVKTVPEAEHLYKIFQESVQKISR